MRGTFVMRNGQIVEKGGPLDVRTEPARSDLPMPMVIGDAMPACEHVDGNFYDSKSAYRRVTKANGLIEVGNDNARLKTPKKPDRAKAIDTAVEKAFARAGL